MMFPVKLEINIQINNFLIFSHHNGPQGGQRTHRAPAAQRTIARPVTRPHVPTSQPLSSRAVNTIHHDKRYKTGRTYGSSGTSTAYYASHSVRSGSSSSWQTIVPSKAASVRSWLSKITHSHRPAVTPVKPPSMIPTSRRSVTSNRSVQTKTKRSISTNDGRAGYGMWR